VYDVSQISVRPSHIFDGRDYLQPDLLSIGITLFKAGIRTWCSSVSSVGAAIVPEQQVCTSNNVDLIEYSSQPPMPSIEAQIIKQLLIRPSPTERRSGSGFAVRG